MRDKDSGVGKGFAFVRYTDPESATVSLGGSCVSMCCVAEPMRPPEQMAIEHLDGIEVCGRHVGVVRSQANTRLFVAGCVRPAETQLPLRVHRARDSLSRVALQVPQDMAE